MLLMLIECRQDVFHDDLMPYFLLPSDRDRTGGWSEQTAKWDNFALDAVQTSRLILFINI